MRFLVTGAARGIGRAVCRQLDESGHELFGIFRPGSEHATDLGLTGFVAADLARPAGLAEALQPLVGSLDRLDGLVHSAGIVRGATAALTTADDFTAQFAVNVTSPAEITRAFLPALRVSAGTVVFVNSGAGLAAGTPLTAYGASKFAVRAYADSLRLEEPGVRVTSVFPGRTATAMQREVRDLEQAAYAPEDYLEVETVASVITSALLFPPDGELSDVVVRPRRNAVRSVGRHLP